MHNKFLNVDGVTALLQRVDGVTAVSQHHASDVRLCSTWVHIIDGIIKGAHPLVRITYFETSRFYFEISSSTLSR